MAGFTENIKLVVDVVTTGAQSQLQQLQGKINDADGGFNKLKAGATGTVDALTSSSALVAGVGVAAVKGVFSLAESFTKSAIEAGKFADATGLSVDASSRLIEVAGDLGVSSSAVESGINKMNKAAATSPGAFDAIGAAIVRTKDGSVDVQATFLNVIDALNRIPDPAQRAAAASKILGKGWTEMAELIGLGADGVVESMKKVNDGIAISDEELAKAKRFRDNLDELKDSAKAVSMTLGGAAADSFGRFFGVLDKGTDTLNKVSSGLGDAFAAGGIGGIGQLVDDLTGSVEGLSQAGADLSGGLEAGKVSAGGFGNALDTAAAKARDAKTAWDLLRGSLSVQDAMLSLQDGFAGVQKSAEDAWNATAEGAADASGKVRDHEQDVVNLKQKVVDYGQKVLDLPPEVVTDILALIDQGKLTEAQAALDKAAAERTAAFKAKEDTGATSAVERAFTNTARTRQALMIADAPNAGGVGGVLDFVARARQAAINATANTGAAESALNNAARARTAIINVVAKTIGAVIPGLATGGPARGVTMVGEKGPELVDLPGGSYVHSADETKRMLSAGMPGSGQGVGGNNITINLPVGSDPSATQRALNRYALRNGSR